MKNRDENQADAQRTNRESTSLIADTVVGALVGMMACAVMAAMVEASAAGTVAALVAGLCVGALIGMVLWVGDNAQPEDEAVVRPPRNEGRDREP